MTWASTRSGVNASAVMILRHFAESSGAAIIENDSLIAAAGVTDYAGPVHNAAIRKDPDADPHEILETAMSFFAARSRRFILWASNHDEDTALSDLAYMAGFRLRDTGSGAAGMYTENPFTESRLPDGVRIKRVRHSAEVPVFSAVVARSFAARSNPQPIQASQSLFNNQAALMRSNVAAFIADLNRTAAGAAMVIIEDGIGALCWVSTLPDARGRGIARALTIACSNAAFENGARLVALQSSSMAERMYIHLGFTEAVRYLRLLSPEPGNRIHLTNRCQLRRDGGIYGK